jgi:hypothetical protein
MFIGEKKDDPLAMYAGDIMTVSISTLLYLLLCFIFILFVVILFSFSPCIGRREWRETLKGPKLD